MIAKGKKPTVVVAAIARELAGFIWAIGREMRLESPVEPIFVRAAPAAAPADKVHRLDTRGGRREGMDGASRVRPAPNVVAGVAVCTE